MYTPSTALAPQDRRELLLFLGFAFLLLAVGIGLRDPWPSDEPRFVLVAKQMVESGDWLFPHRGIELYSDKPPMLFWLQAVAYELVGSWRIAFLLPSLAAGMLTLFLTWDLGRRFWNHRAGLLAAGAVLFAFQFLYQVKRAQIDPLVMAWITLANWGLLLHFLRGPNWRAYWLGCFAAGLGVISKGVGILALLMFVPYLYARLRGWEGATRTTGSGWRWMAGPLAFLAPILAWGGSVLLVAQASGAPEHRAYVDDLFLRQTAGRYAGSWSHPQPFWYFLPVLLLNWFPLSLAYGAAIPRWWRDLRARDARVMLPLVWSALALLFFSIPTGKRDVYVMPLLPMVALAMAPHLDDLLRTRWLRTTAFVAALAIGALFAVAGGWALLAEPSWALKLVRERDLADVASSVWLLFVAIGAVFLFAALLLRPRRGIAALLAGITGLWLLLSLLAYPLLNPTSSAAALMQRARELAGPEAEIGLVAWKEQNLLMARGPVRDFGFRRPWNEQFDAASRWLAEAPRDRRIFILEDAMELASGCIDRARVREIGRANRRKWFLLGADAVTPGCAAKPASATTQAEEEDE